MLEGTSGVGGLRGSEEVGKEESECEGEGGLDSGVPVGLYEISGRVVGTGNAGTDRWDGRRGHLGGGRGSGSGGRCDGHGAAPVFNPPVP